MNLSLPAGRPVIPYKEVRSTEGYLNVSGEWFSSGLGRCGAFTMVFPALSEHPGRTFTLIVNDQPLIPVNFRAAAYRSF